MTMPRKCWKTERLDVVQVCGRGDRIPHWARICLECGLPILAEKPLAMDLPTLGLETGTGVETGTQLSESPIES